MSSYEINTTENIGIPHLVNLEKRINILTMFIKYAVSVKQGRFVGTKRCSSHYLMPGNYILQVSSRPALRRCDVLLDSLIFRLEN